MRNHPKKDQVINIKNGPLKGRSFLVINYLTTQYQGKDIKRIKAPHLTTAMVNRGYPLDDDTVFGQFYPTMEHGCVHDTELKVGKETVPSDPDNNVEPIENGKKNKKNAAKKPARESV